MTTNDSKYYRARAEEERSKAAATSDTLIAASHEQMAQRYLAWSEGIDPDRDPSEAEIPSNDDAADEGNFHRIPLSGQA